MSSFGFGILPAVSWRAVQGRLPAHQPGALPLHATVSRANAQAAARFWTPSRTVEVTQSVGMGRQGSPVSTFNSMHFAGLGAIGCRDVEPLLQELKNIIDRAGDRLSAASLESAKAVYKDIDSYALYIPYLGTDCAKHVNELTATIRALRAELGVNAPPDLRPNVPTSPPGDPLSPTVKFALVGGAVLVGVIATAVITGNVASIVKVFK